MTGVFKDIWSRWRWLLVLGLALRLAAAVFSEGTQSPDEHFQIIEFASMKLGITRPADLPWEYREAIRPAFQPALAVGVIEAARAAGVEDPFVQAVFLRLVAALASSAAILLMLAAFWEDVRSERLRSWFAALSAALWFLLFQSARFSSESLSGAFFFAGLALIILLGRERVRRPGLELLSGFALGLAFITRYQAGFLLAGLGGWMLLVRKDRPSAVALALLGGALAAALGALADRWFYGRWVPTAWNYFYQNLVAGKAAEYGTSPWWFYFKAMALQAYPPFSLAVIAAFLALFVREPRNPLTWSLVPFILVHCAIGHKEPRFLYPLACAVPAACVLAASSVPAAEAWLAWRPAAVPFWALNAVLAAAVVFTPAESYLPFYKYVYRSGLTELATVGVNPYGYRRPMYFYRPPGLVLRDFSTLEEFAAWGRKEKRPLLVAVQGLEPPVLPEELSARPLFRNMPAWVVRFNVNNWLSRTPAVTLCEVTAR